MLRRFYGKAQDIRVYTDLSVDEHGSNAVPAIDSGVTQAFRERFRAANGVHARCPTGYLARIHARAVSIIRQE